MTHIYTREQMCKNEASKQRLVAVAREFKGNEAVVHFFTGVLKTGKTLTDLELLDLFKHLACVITGSPYQAVAPDDALEGELRA